jgi:bifunctional UDP-N-acetylglucosamine pyrophosphorylase/glucosamine-1-phosphate N-acetyltransferase
MQAPETVFFSADTTLSEGVLIEPNVVFGPGVSVKTGSRIRAFSHLEGATVGEHSVIGPYARLRPGATLDEHVHIGNFVEVKNSHIHERSKANHLSYIGDAEIGENSNIGAGTITCNYDGFTKHSTTIGAGVFVGSNTALVAPVTIGDRAIIGAGSTINQDVEADALALARQAQFQTPRGASKFRAKRKKD